MSAERAEAIGSVRHRRPQRPFTQGASRPLKIAEQPARTRVGRLVDLTNTLLREIETLARDQAFTDETGRLQTLLVSDGIDLFQEVKQFEINLIKLALSQTRGHQARAAKLLNINPTTLNSKIKLYGIDY
ncbi:MAG: helix-turn-helix domain-containing protein [Pyrinomonadaceae bacterium]